MLALKLIYHSERAPISLTKTTRFHQLPGIVITNSYSFSSLCYEKSPLFGNHIIYLSFYTSCTVIYIFRAGFNSNKMPHRSCTEATSRHSPNNRYDKQLQYNLCKTTDRLCGIQRKVNFHNRENEYEFVITMPGNWWNSYVLVRLLGTLLLI